MPIVSVTRLHLRSIRFLPVFSWYAFTTTRQAKQTPGNLDVKLRKTSGLAFWTLTLWQTVEAMKNFLFASPHKDAMQQLPHWCDEGSFADWDQEGSEWPSWDEALRSCAPADGWRRCSIPPTDTGQAKSQRPNCTVRQSR